MTMAESLPVGKSCFGSKWFANCEVGDSEKKVLHF